MDDAGLLSFATFSWLTPVMVQGYKHTLTVTLPHCHLMTHPTPTPKGMRIRLGHLGTGAHLSALLCAPMSWVWKSAPRHCTCGSDGAQCLKQWETSRSPLSALVSSGRLLTFGHMGSSARHSLGWRDFSSGLAIASTSASLYLSLQESQSAVAPQSNHLHKVAQEHGQKGAVPGSGLDFPLTSLATPSLSAFNVSFHLPHIS